MEYLYQKAGGFSVGNESFGPDRVVLMAGPCSVESEGQASEIASKLSSMGLGFMRGGAFKPRSSPYSFQGLGKEGVGILEKACRENGLKSVSEVMDSSDIGMMEGIDVLQVGTRNSQNFTLLKELGRSGRPVLLKRALSGTLEELLMSAEYIMKEGNNKVLLCERGIRTYETATRNTLDISAVPILKSMTELPVIVDPTHAAGRKDILLALSKASIAAGANGLLVEVHPDPENAKSDQKQQMDMNEFREYVEELRDFCRRTGKELA